MTTLTDGTNHDEITIKIDSMDFSYQCDDVEMDDYNLDAKPKPKSTNYWSHETFSALEQFPFVDSNSDTESNYEPECSYETSMERKRSHTEQEKSRKKKVVSRKRDKADGNQEKSDSKGEDGGSRSRRRETSPPMTRSQSKPALRMRIKMSNKYTGVVETPSK